MILELILLLVVSLFNSMKSLLGYLLLHYHHYYIQYQCFVSNVTYRTFIPILFVKIYKDFHSDLMQILSYLVCDSDSVDIDPKRSYFFPEVPVSFDLHFYSFKFYFHSLVVSLRLLLYLCILNCLFRSFLCHIIEFYHLFCSTT